MRIPGRSGRYILVGLACSLLVGFVFGWSSSRRFKLSADPQMREMYVREKGDATAAVRAEVSKSLREFQEGYTRRNPADLDAFMARLFPRELDVRVIGTDADEWKTGYESIRQFIRNDWLKWGDVRLAVNDAVISSKGDAAWLATTGTVTSVGSARSIRFDAVLTRYGGRWLFRQVHFQYDERLLGLTELLTGKAWSQIQLW